MRRLIYIWATINILISGSLFAQQAEMDHRQRFALAESEYQIGHLDNAIDMLNWEVATYSGTLKVSAYRLLALCYLAQDDMENANQCVDLLLKEDPYYSISFNDPERFAELIRNRKEGKTTLVTASQQAETVEEAPVPVTLITEEMIEAIGARTLKDVLIAYVPGITSVESPNEVNVATHGVYSAGQEKILIMLNGQRMNARATNKAAPDYSISLDKVKQIEVLRGPASSLYGNVALMAVVNLITKEGSDVNGVEASVGFGNFGQKKGSLLVGKRFMDMDFMGWASIYASDGQKRFVSAQDAIGTNPHDGYAWTEGYNRLPSYDFGFTFKWRKITLNFNQRYGKKIPTHADVYSSMGALYDYDKYLVTNGEGPGHGMSFTHAGISYLNQFGNWSIDINGYFDLNKSSLYSLIGDGVSGVAAGDTATIYSPFQIMRWSEYSLGGIALANYTYPQLGILGKGNLLVGMQLEYIRLYGKEGFIGSEYTNIISSFPTPVQTGAESTYSPFIQLKHYFNKKLILNAGARYDIKRRANKNVVTSISPRISLIYLLNDKINIKANYGRSFVDAPYFYRYNGLPSYKGLEDMESEYMEAFQASISYHPIPALSYNSVFFYNNLTGLIYRDPTATGNDPRYINGGELRTIGLENTIQYHVPRFMANFNLTYQNVLGGTNYSFSGHRIHNIPNWFMNLVLNGNVVKKSEHELWLYANASLTGPQLSPIDHVMIGGETVVDLENQLPAIFIANAGARYRFKNIELELTFYNLFDKTYYQGGSTFVPYIQQGFSILGTLRYILRR